MREICLSGSGEGAVRRQAPETAVSQARVGFSFEQVEPVEVLLLGPLLCEGIEQEVLGACQAGKGGPGCRLKQMRDEQGEEADKDDRRIREVRIERPRDCRVQTSYRRGQLEEHERMQRKEAD